MMTSDWSVLIITAVSLVGAVVCCLVLFTKQVNYMRRADYHLKRNRLPHVSPDVYSDALSASEQEALMA